MNLQPSDSLNYNIFREFSKFNNIKFYEEPHVYFIDDSQVISVTGLIHKFTDEFDEEKWLHIKAEEFLRDGSFVAKYNSEAQALESAKIILKAEWTYKNRHGIYEGKLVHRYLENIMANKDVLEDTSGNEMVTFSDIEKTFFMMKKLANDFYREYVQSGILLPVKSELVVGAIELGLAGQIDQLFYNTRLNSLQLYDWKTNRKLDMSSKFSMKHCLSHLDSCEFNTYSLQLYTYKYLLEKNTNIRLNDKLNIVWFNEFNETPNIIECRDMSNEVQMMLEFKKEHEEMFKIRPHTRPGIPEFKIEKASSMEDLLKF